MTLVDVDNLTITNTGGTLGVDAGAMTNADLLTIAGSGGAVTVTGLSANLTSTSAAAVGITLDGEAAGNITTTITNNGANGATVNTGDFNAGDTLVLAGTRTVAVTAAASTNITTGAVAASVAVAVGQTAAINATAMADDLTLTLSGAGAATVTGLRANVTSAAEGANSFTLVDVANLTATFNHGTNTVDATQMTFGDVLTIAGATAGSTTVNSANATINASTYERGLTLTVGNTQETTVAIGTGAARVNANGTTTLTINGAAGVATTGGALTLAGGATGNVTITNLEGGLTIDNGYTGLGVVDITVANFAQALALGTSTTGTRTVNANALQDERAVTMSGSDAVTVSLVLGNLTGTTYAGNMTVTATTGTNVIVTGAGNDIITGGAAVDNITAGLGNDTIIFAGATGVAAAGSIARVTTLGNDVIADFTSADDVFNFSETDFGDLNGGAGVGALNEAQVVVLANLTTALNTANAQIDGAGEINATNGAFAVIGTNAATETVALYFIQAGATVGNTVTQAVAANEAVQIGTITLVGGALVLADFVGVA